MNKKFILIILFVCLDIAALDFTKTIDMVFNKTNTLDLNPNFSIILNKEEYDLFLSNPKKIIEKYKQLSNVDLSKLYIYKQKTDDNIYYKLSRSSIFSWKPNKIFLKKLPRFIAKHYFSFNVSILSKFYNKKHTKLYIVFSAEYSLCHACEVVIMYACIDTVTNKIMEPLQYITTAGASGTAPYTKHIHLYDDTEGLFLFSSFTAQGFITGYTDLLGFSDGKAKLIFSIIENGQIQNCIVHLVKPKYKIKKFLEKDIQRKAKIIEDDDSNVLLDDNFSGIAKSSLCDIFIKKNKNNFPKILKCITKFKKFLQMDTLERITYRIKCDNMIGKQK